MSSRDLAAGGPATAGRRVLPATAWERVWFTPAPAWSYRLVVVLVLGLAAISLAAVPGTLLDALGASDPGRWQPVGYYRLLPQPRGGWLDVAATVTAVGCVAAAAANRPWLYRVVAPAAAYLIGFANNFGKVNHGSNVLVIALVAIAVGAYRVGDPTARGWRFRWPGVAVRSAIGLMFLFAAVSKLRVAGIGWVTSDNMRNVLVMETTLLRDVHAPAAAAWIASAPWRWQLAALGALVGEAATIGAVLARRPLVRVVAALHGVGVLLGLNLLLDLGGLSLLVLSLLLLDVESVPLLPHRWRRPVVVLHVAVGAVIAVVATVLQPNVGGWAAAALTVLVTVAGAWQATATADG